MDAVFSSKQQPPPKQHRPALLTPMRFAQQ
jgi:hypothetical protein